MACFRKHPHHKMRLWPFYSTQSKFLASHKNRKNLSNLLKARMIVPGRGNPNAKLAFIGEAPGDEEFRIGKPFVGPSGQMLSNILGHNTLSESEVWIDNVCQKKTKGRNPSFEEIKEAIPGLRDRLRKLSSLNCIVAVGDVALRALSIFEFSGITKYRGSILPARLCGKKMVPIVHPAWIMKDGNHEYRYLHVSISDITRAKLESNYPDIRRPNRNHAIIYNLDEAIWRIRTLKSTKMWAFDLETSLSCLGFAPSRKESFTIPFQSETRPIFWTQKEKAFLIEELKTLFTKEAKIITQNGLFDKEVLWKDYGIDPESWDIYADTMYMHQLLYPELPHSLAFISSIYTEEPFYKDEGREWKRGRDSEESFFKYNGKDCCVTLESFEEMLKELRETAQEDYFFQVIMPIVPILFKMHLNGVLIGQKELSEAKRILSRRETIARIKLHQSLGFEINPRSSIEMEAFLRTIGIPEKELVRSEKTGRVKADEDYLRRIYAKHKKLELLHVLDIRNSQYLQSGYTNFSRDSTGRFHALFKLGPKSGRLAGSGDKKGPQLQNIPVPTKSLNLRRIFVAPPNRKFVAIDLQQADTRVLAYFAPEPMLIKLFESEDSDIHSQVTAEICGIPRDQITKETPERKIMKVVGHGTNYGMGPRKLVNVCRENGIFISEADSKRWQTAYFIRFLNLKVYHLNTQAELRKTRILVDLNGRRHLFLGYFDDTTYREAYSRPPQATVAGIMLKGMINLQREINSHVWQNEPLLLIQVHDEMIVECDDSDVSLIAKLMNRCFSIPLTAHSREFTIPMTTSSGQRWGELKQWGADGFPNT